MASSSNTEPAIHSLALVESTSVGAGTRIWAWTHVLPQARIGRNCNIGEHCFIENQVVVGDDCTIKNGVALWNGVTLEDHVFVGPGVVFTNDKYPRSRQTWKLQPTVIRRWATLGAGSVLLCGIEIGSFALVAAGAVVTTSVPPFALIKGNPGQLTGYVCACARLLNPAKQRVMTCRQCGRTFRAEPTLEWTGGPPLP